MSDTPLTVEDIAQAMADVWNAVGNIDRIVDIVRPRDDDPPQLAIKKARTGLDVFIKTHNTQPETPER